MGYLNSPNILAHSPLDGVECDDGYKIPSRMSRTSGFKTESQRYSVEHFTSGEVQDEIQGEFLQFSKDIVHNFLIFGSKSCFMNPMVFFKTSEC